MSGARRQEEAGAKVRITAVLLRARVRESASFLLVLAVVATACTGERKTASTAPSASLIRDRLVATTVDGGETVDAGEVRNRLQIPVRRAYRVRVTPDLWEVVGRAPGIVGELVVELFPDVSLDIANVRLTNGQAGVSLRAGGLDTDATLSLVASRVGLTGTVLAQQITYQLVSETRDTALALEVDVATLPPEEAGQDPPSRTSNRDAPVLPPASLSSHGATRTLQATPDHVHDLLVVFTDDVARMRPDAASAIQDAVSLANQAYENSNVAIDLALVSAQQVTYDETGELSEDLDRLQATNDGVLDQVHRLRDRHAADLVALVVADGGDSCGIANLAVISSDADDDSAFAVVDISCFTNSTLAHELGHIGGAHHNTGQDPTPLPIYAHGWVRPDQFGPGSGWRSVMAYPTGDCGDPAASCPRSPPAFSNPDIRIGGRPAGNRTANNARRLNETAQTLAGFRITGPRLSLYEGGQNTQDHVCVVSAQQDNLVNFTTDPNERNCDNDEARSATLFGINRGRVIRLYDSPSGSREDDWTEIIAKRNIDEANIPSFQRSYEDADVRVTYHRNNGLDGKVSRLEISGTATGPTIDLHEGNEGTQNLLCSLSALQPELVRFTGHTSCDNDEARSLTMYAIPSGKVVRIFDSPNGSQEDDWAEIIAKRNIVETTVPSFEASYEDADVRVTYHRNNGLDGKVSLIEISDTPTGPTVDLYEGSGASQNLVCALPVGQPRSVRFPGHPQCDNDEARSLILHNLAPGTVLLLFDSPDGNLDDDWTAIRATSAITSQKLNSFETSFTSSNLEVVYARNNGLDGKVSRLEVTTGDRLQGIASFYEGNGGSQNKVCDLQLRDQEVRFRGHGSCDNDEARSVVLSQARTGTTVRVFDDPDCETSDDFTTIRTKRAIFRLTISSFERSTNNSDVEIAYRRDNGLDGKVSCIQIDA